MFICLRCGTVRYGSRPRKDPSCKTPGCIGREVFTTRRLLPVVAAFDRLGYAVESGGEFLQTIDTGNIDIAMVNVEFRRWYPIDCFPDLPPPWVFYAPQEGKGNYCRIVHTEEYLTFMGATHAKDAVKEIVDGLYLYVTELEKAHVAEVFALAGWL